MSPLVPFRVASSSEGAASVASVAVVGSWPGTTLRGVTAHTAPLAVDLGLSDGTRY
eukprot:gene26470-30392_t